MEIRACSLCRFKIPNNYPRKPNYALVAMLEKNTRREAEERAHQATQTEPGLVGREQAPARSRVQRPSMLEGKAMTVAIKRSGIELIFK